MKKIGLIVLMCIPLFFFKEAYGQSQERWYAVSIGGSPVGYLLEKNESSESANTSLVEMNISFGRLGSEVKMQTKTLQTEKDGQLTDINMEMNFSNELKVESVKVLDDHLIIDSQGNERSLPLDTKLTGPGALEKILVHEIRNGRQDIVYTTYSAELGMYLNGELTFIGSEKVVIDGLEYNAIIAEERFQELPYVRKKWLNEQGLLLKSNEPSPFGDMEIVRTNKENALNVLDNSVDLPEEKYGSTMAYANYRLSHPRELSSIKINITQNRPEFGFPDFAGDYQKIISQSAEEIVLQIDQPTFNQEHSEPVNLDEYLEPNAFLDNGDELLIAKTKEVIGDETDDWEKVKLILQWVRKNMTFDAGIALADSREVIRDLKGTCVSFAMLTSTMSKAAGIPSRFLMGYVYVDGAWGGHAWSEVYLNGQWIPIDAAVPNDTYIADAARFFMVRSSLKEGMGKGNIAGMQLFGNINVKIVEYNMNGNTFATTETPFTIDDKHYINPGLQFAMKQLQGFQFSDMDSFYPEIAILKQSNGPSEIFVAHYTYGTVQDTEDSMLKVLNQSENTAKPQSFKTDGFDGLKVTGKNKSVAIIMHSSKAFFSLTTTGPDHDALIAQALEAIKYRVN